MELIFYYGVFKFDFGMEVWLLGWVELVLVWNIN